MSLIFTFCYLSLFLSPKISPAVSAQSYRPDLLPFLKGEISSSCIYFQDPAVSPRLSPVSFLLIFSAGIF